MPAGRPPKRYDPLIAEEICERISHSHFGLASVLDDMRDDFPTVPSRTTVYVWLDENKEFADNFSRACNLRADYLADYAVQESHTSRIGEIRKVTPKGDEITVADNVERSKLIVSATFKRIGQLNPKKYGERVQNVHTDAEGGPVQFVTRSILDAKE